MDNIGKEILNELHNLSNGFCIMQSDISDMKSDVAELKEDVTVLKTEVKELRADADLLKTDAEVLKNKVTVPQEKAEALKIDVLRLESEMMLMKTDVSKIYTNSEELKNRVSGIEITLETVTNHHIAIVAENHTDLERKLSRAIETESERRQRDIRISKLESDVSVLTEKVDFLYDNAL